MRTSATLAVVVLTAAAKSQDSRPAPDLADLARDRLAAIAAEVMDDPAADGSGVADVAARLVALVAGGNDMRAGEHRAAVRFLVKWLQDRQDQESGRFGEIPLEEHALATWAIVLTYGRSSYAPLKKNAQKAVNHLQNSAVRPEQATATSPVAAGWLSLVVEAGARSGLTVMRRAPGIWVAANSGPATRPDPDLHLAAALLARVVGRTTTEADPEILRLMESCARIAITGQGPRRRGDPRAVLFTGLALHLLASGPRRAAAPPRPDVTASLSDPAATPYEAAWRAWCRMVAEGATAAGSESRLALPASGVAAHDALVTTILIVASAPESPLVGPVGVPPAQPGSRPR